MQTLHFEFSGGVHSPRPGVRPAVAGLVASSNLEVLAEPMDLKGGCVFEIATSVPGFDEIWKAVLADFMERQKPKDTRFAINDFAATPPVVSFRLDQAWESISTPPSSPA